MGLLSFLLGVSVTILLYRLRRHNDRKKQEDREVNFEVIDNCFQISFSGARH